MKVEPSYESFAAGYEAGKPSVLFTRLVADLETPVSAMMKLADGKSYSFLLESVEGGAVRGRYSLIGLKPDLVWRCSADKPEINRRFRVDPRAFEPCAGGGLASLRALVAETRVELPSGLPPMAAGLIGYMGYDMVRLMEELPTEKPPGLGLPDSVFLRPTVMAIFDNVEDLVTIITSVWPEAGVSARAAYNQACERLADTVADFGRNLPERREVVDALVASVRAAYPRLSHRYYRLKAGWFKKKKLAHWDRNAPLPFAATNTIAWAEARNMVLTAYRGFSPEMAEIAERFFTDRWIDAPVRPGKAPGAFSHPTTPSAHPYVLMNYQGKPRDVMTLAHELGHGVHQVLAAKNGALMAPTPLTLAETASVFGEMLTFRRLLSQTSNQKQRQALLAGKVEDMINTVVRQIAFYSFERAIHTERKNGELTAEQIGQLWLSVQGESLGPAIEIKPGYENFWMYIPHFIHSPFYVYAYAFGDCLVNSLYAVYEHAADGFAERYLAMLAAGGTKHYSELLKPFGLNAKDPKFWDGGLSVISGMIDELETMS